MALGDVEHGGDVDVTMWDGASSGLLDQSDIDEVAAVIEPGSLAGILVYENLWAVPLMTALDRSTAAGHPGAMPGPAGHPGPMAAPAGAPQATAAGSASPSGGDVLDQLAKLGELKAAGVLTEDEFQAQKARILSS